MGVGECGSRDFRPPPPPVSSCTTQGPSPSQVPQQVYKCGPVFGWQIPHELTQATHHGQGCSLTLRPVLPTPARCLGFGLCL